MNTAATHEVFNQALNLENYNLFDGNQALQSALKFNAPGLDTTDLQALGAQMGSAEMQTHAQLANVHTPQLRSHDRYGNRTDVVEFHPSYHALMAAAAQAGLHGTPWGGTAAQPAPLSVRKVQGHRRSEGHWTGADSTELVALALARKC